MPWPEDWQLPSPSCPQTQPSFSTLLWVVRLELKNRLFEQDRNQSSRQWTRTLTSLSILLHHHHHHHHHHDAISYFILLRHHSLPSWQSQSRGKCQAYSILFSSMHSLAASVGGDLRKLAMEPTVKNCRKLSTTPTPCWVSTRDVSTMTWSTERQDVKTLWQPTLKRQDKKIGGSPPLTGVHQIYATNSPKCRDVPKMILVTAFNPYRMRWPCSRPPQGALWTQVGSKVMIQGSLVVDFCAASVVISDHEFLRKFRINYVWPRLVVYFSFSET